jgi:hypothetical protein
LQLLRHPLDDSNWHRKKRMRATSLVLVLAVGVAACSSPFGPDEARLLASSRAQWSDRAFPDYTFDVRHGCFCTPEQTGPVRVIVRQGSIESVTLLETGEAADPAEWFTLEQLFDRIPVWAKNEGVDDVTVDYDPTLGFPSSVEIKYEQGILDAGDVYTVSNVGPA